MANVVYTHAVWRVKPGHEQQFIEAWRELARVFTGLAVPPLWGSLLRNTADRSVFYSFGPWRNLQDAQAMRADPEAQRAIAAVRQCCLEATPEICELVDHVKPAVAP